MEKAGEMLKQIGMTAGAIKNDFAVFLVNAIDEKPVRFNMTFPFFSLISMQGMIFVFWKQWLFVNQQISYFGELIHVFTAFFHQLAVLFKRSCNY
jgi:hypothetical protein